MAKHCAPVIAFMLLASAAATQGTEPTTCIEVHHALTAGFQTSSAVEAGTARFWVTNGYPIVFMSREEDPPNLIQLRQKADHMVLSVSAGSANRSGGTLSCCTWDCSKTYYGLSLNGNCVVPNGYCEECTKRCTDGWTACPAGTTEGRNLDLLYAN